MLATAPLKSILILFVLLLQACGGGGGSSSAAVPTPAPATPAPQPTPDPPAFGIEARPNVAEFIIPGVTASTMLDSGNYALVNAFPNLSFPSALFIAGVPDSQQLAVVRQTGQIEVFEENPSNSSTTTILDLSDVVLFAGEQGLLGLAFDPDFTSNRFIYVHYSRSGPRRSVISRFTWPSGVNQVERSSEKVVLEVNQPFSNHNGGMLAFGPDDYLYVALGDGGAGGDPQNHGQDTSTLLGNLLRLDVHPDNDAEPYLIPPDNPFVADGAFRPEIFAYGLRNPFRFSFDRQTGDIWLGDVGQNSQEEINIITAGSNYGWRVFEGTARFDDSLNNLPDSAFTSPVITYGRDQGVSVIGGYVYRGNDLAELRGRYFFSDFGSGEIWAARYDGVSVTDQVSLGTLSLPSSFGESNSGELYITSLNGGVFKIEESEPSGNSGLLSETGLFTNVANLTPASGLIEYTVNHGFWSDGTAKRRWLAIPDGQTITFSSGRWSFPNGTVLVKHFAYGSRPVETRVMQKTGNDWSGLSFEWQADGLDAELLSSGKTVTIDGQPYEYPSPTDCFSCHTNVSGTVLGIRTEQLNANLTYPSGVTDNQLRTLNHIDLFNSDIGDPAQFDAYASRSGVGNIAERARTYLQVNCAMCHQPGGPTPVTMDLRLTSTINGNNLSNQPSETNPGAQLIVPGNKEASVIWQRISSLGNDRMPPLGSRRLDEDGIRSIGEWIDSL